MTVRTKQQLDEIRTVKSSWGKGCKGRRKASVPWVNEVGVFCQLAGRISYFSIWNLRYTTAR